MKLWSAWLPELRPHVPGCPDVLAKAEILRAAQVLLEQTRAWQIDLSPLPVGAGQSTVTAVMTEPAEQKLVRVEAAWLDGARLRPITLKQLDAGGSDDWKDHTGTPCRFLQLTPGVVTLYPKPVNAAVSGLKLRASVMPAETATGLPDDIADRFVDIVQSGARSRLLMYPKKPWTDTNMAGVYAGGFMAGLNRAKVEADKSFAGGRIEASPGWC